MLSLGVHAALQPRPAPCCLPPADARHLARREEHKSTTQVCEHGVVRCRICFPHKGSGK